MAAEAPFLTAAELAERYRGKDLSPVEAVRTLLERIEAMDGACRAFITVMSDAALRSARQAEQALVRGESRGPLHGVPVAVKDLVATAGVRTTCGSKVLGEWIPDQDATIIARFREAGVILLGKTNLHEFAFGPTGINPHYGTSRNPWDAGRVPGGSSSGSATAVGDFLCPLAVGTDTGGSVRIPAACCGIVGLKPTYGRVSRFGVFPLSWSLDHVGPLTRTVRDAALMLQVMAGPDPRDPSSAGSAAPDYGAALGGDVRGLRVGILGGYFDEEVDPEVRAAVQEAGRVLERLGAAVERVILPHVAYAPAVSFAILVPEALAVHERRLRQDARQYGRDVLERLLQGLGISASQYVKGQRARAILRRDVRAAWKRVDVLLAPTLPVVAPQVSDREVSLPGGSEGIISALTRFTRPFNITGHPAISVPCGFSKGGLPIGLQLVGKAYDEATVLKVAYAYEQHTEWHKRRPPLTPVPI